MLLFTASGTGAMESAVANLLSPGDRVLVVSAGDFGERWAADRGRVRRDVEHARATTWGETPRPTTSPRRLAERGGAKVVFLDALRDLDRRRRRRRRRSRPSAKAAGALVVVDAVSSLGAVPLETDAWGLDVVVSGSQKALMTPPGPRARRRLAGRAGSARARDARRASTSTGSGRARRRRRSTRRSRRPSRSSPALDVALGLLLDEGLEAAFDRHAALGRACREGAKAMGLELFSPDEDRSAVVTAIRVPDGRRRRPSSCSRCATASGSRSPAGRAS